MTCRRPCKPMTWAVLAGLLPQVALAAPVLALDAAERALLGIVTAPARAATVRLVEGLPGDVSLPIAGSSAVTAPYAGRVQQVLVDSGDTVRAGEVLAWVDSRDLVVARTRVREAELAHELARTVATRDAALLAEGVIPAARAEASAAALAASDTERAGARAAVRGLVMHADELTRYALVAPLDGVVAERHIGAGDPLDTLALAFVLAAPTQLQLEIQVPHALARDVEAGMRARVGKVVAPISGRASRVDGETQSLRLRAQLPPDSGLALGQRVVVGLELPVPAGAVEIPRTALVRGAASVQVYRAVAGGFEPVDVTVLGESAASAIVSATLAPGDEVVVTGTSVLHAIER